MTIDNPFPWESRFQFSAMMAHTESRAERLIVTLYYADGLSTAEIGKMLRLSEPRVRFIHETIRARLRPPEDGGHSSGSPVPRPPPASGPPGGWRGME